MTKGTCNGADRGNTTNRRRRKEWLIQEYRANVDAGPDGRPVPRGEGRPAARCFRCGDLLTMETITPDRINPGVKGGSYRRENCRPSCLPCQWATGNEIKRALRCLTEAEDERQRAIDAADDASADQDWGVGA